jgi:hypothetical protein
MSEQSTESKWDGLVTALVIITTIVLALNAWRAAMTADSVAGSDYQGIRALTKAESVRTTDTVDAYEDYRLFLNYQTNTGLADALEEFDGLERDVEESRQLAQIDVSFLDESKASRYLDRSGGYAIERQLGEKWAAAARQYELNHKPRFEDGDRLRKIKRSQLIAGLVLTVALFFLTLCRIFHGTTEKVLMGIGTLLLLGGSLWALVLEMSKS